MSNAARKHLIDELMRIIDFHRREYEIDCVDVAGILELIKHDMLNQSLEAAEEEGE